MTRFRLPLRSSSLVNAFEKGRLVGRYGHGFRDAIRDGSARTGQCCGEAIAVDRLQQIVHGFQPEGFDGELLVRGGEDDVRRLDLVFAQTADNAEAVEAGHLDIEKGQGGIELFDQVESFEAVGGGADHFDIADLFEQEAQFFAGELFIVGNDGGHWNRAGNRSGNRRAKGHGLYNN